MTPTAPLVRTTSSSASRFVPGRVAADARPPTIVSSGTRPLHKRKKSGTGNENGSASSSNVPRDGSESGQPLIVTPSSDSSASSATAVQSPTANEAPKTLRPGPSSISVPPPATPAMTQPITTCGSSNLASPAMTSSNTPAWCGDAKTTSRSGAASWNRSNNSPATSPTASTGVGCSDSAAAYRFTRSIARALRRSAGTG